MKIGWLVWKYAETRTPELWTYEPDYGFKVVKIVYAEVVE